MADTDNAGQVVETAPAVLDAPIDTDGEAIKNLLADVNAPPPAVEIPTTPADVSVAIPAPGHNRLVQQTYILSPADLLPIQIAKADATRIAFIMEAWAETATDEVLYAVDPGVLGFPLNCGHLHVGLIKDLSAYTGPLWIRAGASNNADKTVSISVDMVVK